MSNTSFGKNVLTNNFDPALLDGWGVRPSDWNLGVVDSSSRSARGRRSTSPTPAAGSTGFRSPTTCALAAVRSDAVQHRGAARSAPARRRRLRRLGPLRRRAREGRAGRQPRRRLGDVRQLVAVLQRRRRHGQRPRRQRASPSSAAPAPVRPSPTTATSARACRSSRRRRPARARSAPGLATPP